MSKSTAPNSLAPNDPVIAQQFGINVVQILWDPNCCCKTQSICGNPVHVTRPLQRIAASCNIDFHPSVAAMKDDKAQIHFAAVRAKLNKHCYHQHMSGLGAVLGCDG